MADYFTGYFTSLPTTSFTTSPSTIDPSTGTATYTATWTSSGVAFHVRAKGSVCEKDADFGDKLGELLDYNAEMIQIFKDLYNEAPVWPTPETVISKVIDEMTEMPREIVIIHACSRNGYIAVCVRQ